MVNSRYAIIRKSDDYVFNVCVWDGVTPWEIPSNKYYVVDCPEYVGPGWYYINGEWINPPPPPEE